LVLAGPGSASGQDVHIGGRVSSELLLGTEQCFRSDPHCPYLNLQNTNVLGIRLWANLGKKVAVVGAVDLRNVNFAEVEDLEDAGEPDRVLPVHARIEDAYIDLYGVLLKRLDLRIGAQRIRWGTGDGVNPTDRINPYDLEDPTVFDRRLATLAMLATYQAGKVRFEVVVAPLFVPAVLPMDGVDFMSVAAPSEGFDLNEYVTDDREVELRDVDTSIELPGYELGDTALGARVLWSGTTGDLGISYYHGRDSLPQGHGDVLLTGYATDHTRVDVLVPMVYPRIDVVGLEGRLGPFGSLTLWAEAALVFAEQTALSGSEDQLGALFDMGVIDVMPDPLPSQVTQDGKPYVQPIAGGDLSFPFGLYLNLQYLRGFPTERQASEQGNYILSAVRYTFPGGNVVLSNELGIEIRDDGTPGYMVSPELSLMFGDAVELSAGAIWMGGKQGSHFRTYRGLSHIKLSASVEF